MSGKVAIQKSTLEAIGEAVRNKEGSTDLIPVNTLADRITALPNANKLSKLIERSVTEITAEALEGCTFIGPYAFGDWYKLKSVTIPSNITSIEGYAFQNCHNLANLTINSSGFIGESAFSSCKQVTSVTIPDSITGMSANVFRFTNIKSVTVGNGITYFDGFAFKNMKKLINFTIASPFTVSMTFAESTELTIDSLKNIINALVDYSGTEKDSKYTLTLNSSCLATLDTEGATAPDGLTWSEYVWAKGWNLA